MKRCWAANLHLQPFPRGSGDCCGFERRQSSRYQALNAVDLGQRQERIPIQGLVEEGIDFVASRLSVKHMRTEMPILSAE